MSSLSLGILGEHISYSLSPRIFDWAFRETASSGEYRIFDLSQPDAREFLLRDQSWHGLNVTTPYKEFAFELCTELSNTAAATKAVNVITRAESGLRGDNTDVAGFRFALDLLTESSFRPDSILIIGSGGAARAVLHGLNERYPASRVEVASREPNAAKQKLQELLAPFASASCIDMDTAAHFLKDFDLVIQASPVGSEKQFGSPLSGQLKFRNNASVMDLIYAPRSTRFLELAAASGARTQNGLPMLIGQAAEAFCIWTGQLFPLDKAMTELLPQLNAA